MTCDDAVTSIPRLITSVAIRYLISPVRNAAMIFSRCVCGRSPWITAALGTARLRSRYRLSAHRLRSTKIRHCRGCSRSMHLEQQLELPVRIHREVRLADLVHRQLLRRHVQVDRVVHVPVHEPLDRVGGTVADMSSVCRSVGHRRRIRSMSRAEADVEHPVGLVEHARSGPGRASSSRGAGGRAPGRACRRRGRSRPAAGRAGCCIPLPPYTGHGRNCRLGASLSASSATWRASSRVGVMTMADRPLDVCGRQRFRNGSRNAAVLPVPVWAWPITSLPARAMGITASWMGLGSR